MLAVECQLLAPCQWSLATGGRLTPAIGHPIPLNKEGGPMVSRCGRSVYCGFLANSRLHMVAKWEDTRFGAGSLRRCRGKQSVGYAENWEEYAGKLPTCYTSPSQIQSVKQSAVNQRLSDTIPSDPVVCLPVLSARK